MDLAPVCEAIARLLAPHAEVVLHDPATDTIVGIWNPLSGRTVGDPSLLSELPPLDSAVYGPYPKSLPDGRALSSVSAVLRDASGRPEAVLCVNVDRTAFDMAARVLAGFAAPVTGQPQALFERDWTETLNSIVGAYVRSRGVPVERLDRAGRLELLAELDKAGVFSHRRSVPVVGQAMRISRSAVYQLLAESRKDPHAD
ncbi:PAS domain-containing protein [Kibdelosporangium lantanae]